ncbi:MAG: AzlC family ABC transporter permease [Janthinobacterium lividum]
MSNVITHTNNCRGEFTRGLLASTPVLIGLLPAALVLGAQATAKGMAPLAVPLMTGSNFAGGSEFAAVGLWTSPPHLLLIVGVTLLVNSRHLVMGATLAPWLRHVPRRHVLPALFLMVDESWAMALADAQARGEKAPASAFSLHYFMGVAAGLYISWLGFTALGAWLGPVLGDIERWGFDMAFPAVFLVLLRGMWKGAGAAVPWLVSLIVAAGTYLTVPGAWYVPAGALLGIAVAWIRAWP